MPATDRVAVIGLGYVGLPLAVALSHHVETIGFDVDTSRIADLESGHDRSGEISARALRDSTLSFSADATAMADAEIFIVATPTPVDADNRPDLTAVEAACDTVGGVLGQGAIVVFESTVYPGVTEDVCGPRPGEGIGARLRPGFLSSGIRRNESIPATENIPSTASPRSSPGRPRRSSPHWPISTAR